MKTIPISKTSKYHYQTFINATGERSVLIVSTRNNGCKTNLWVSSIYIDGGTTSQIGKRLFANSARGTFHLYDTRDKRYKSHCQPGEKCAQRVGIFTIARGIHNAHST